MTKSKLLCFVCMLTSSVVKAQIPSLDEIKTEPVTVTTGITFFMDGSISRSDLNKSGMSLKIYLIFKEIRSGS